VTRRGSTAPHRIGVVVFDGVKLLDVAGPSEVFAEANLFGGRYQLELCSVGGVVVRSSTGIPLAVDHDAAAPRLGFDTLLIAGGDVFPTHPVEAALREATRALAARSARICSICTGAFVLAETGLLEGRRATTHWRHTQLLARAYRGITVEPDAIFVRDGNFYTSAGVSAGIDLALALVENDHGEDVARTVAQSLVVFLQRPGGQSQFSPTLAHPRPHTATLRTVVDAVAADPAGNHSTAALAARAAVSQRHLARLFQEEMDTTPGAYVESVRFDAAKTLLEQGHTITATTTAAGYGSAESLRRAFITRLGIAPRAYQQRFRTAHRDDSRT
jgi:transcriptional regulator GlxA family with amidase domain